MLGVKLVGGNKSWVRMHSIVVASLSRLLRHLLLQADANDDCSVNTIILPDASQADLDSIVEIAYAGKCELLSGGRSSRKLGELAHTLGISCLQRTEVEGSNIKEGVFGNAAGQIEGKRKHQHAMSPGDMQRARTEYSSRGKELVEVEDHLTNSVKHKLLEFECQNFKQISKNRKRPKKESVLKQNLNIYPGDVLKCKVDQSFPFKDIPIRYKCNTCGKSFSRRNDLKRHQMLHSGERKFSCSFCAAKFVSRGDLNKHVRAHTGEKPYHCNFLKCTKAFALNGDLNKHKRIHSEDKRFKCEQCHYRCIQSTDLKNHMLIHINSKPFLCNMCQKSFRKKSQLKEHLKRQHIPAS